MGSTQLSGMGAASTAAQVKNQLRYLTLVVLMQVAKGSGTVAI